LAERDGLRNTVRGLLSHVGDLERQLGRVTQGVASPRELLAMAESLGRVADVPMLLDGPGLGPLAAALFSMDECEGTARSRGAGGVSALTEPTEEGDDSPANTNGSVGEQFSEPRGEVDYP